MTEIRPKFSLYEVELILSALQKVFDSPDLITQEKQALSLLHGKLQRLFVLAEARQTIKSLKVLE